MPETGYGFNLQDGDWTRVRRLFQLIGSSLRLGPTGKPAFANLSLSGDLTIAGDVVVTGSGRFDGGVAIGKDPGANRLWIYKSAATGIGLVIDNLGAGDATIRFALSDVAKFVLGVDNSDGDKFKIAEGSGLGTNTILTIDSSGNFDFNSGNFANVGTIAGGTYNAMTINPTASWLQISANAAADYWAVQGYTWIQGNADGFQIHGSAVAGVDERVLTVTGGDWTIDKDVSGLLGATPGTASASLALIVDASKDIDLDGGDIKTAGTITIENNTNIFMTFHNTGASGREYYFHSSTTGLFGIRDADAFDAYRLQIDANGYVSTPERLRIGSVVAPTVALDVAGAALISTTLGVAGNLSMGNDALIAADVNAGLTASTTQSQGQGALTAQVNEISTVANKDDTVTLPSAVTGIMIEIINNGANTLQIFPASGDDLGLGVNTAEELEANERVGFVAYDTTNWAKEFSTEIIHAEIHDEDNTDAFVINDAGGDFHSYHTNGLVAGDLADWAFDAGGAGTSFPIASIADGADSGVDIAVTTTGTHGLEVGDIISQTNLADAAYVGVFVVKAIISTTVYEVAAAYTADGTGTMDQAATLEANAVAAGVYSFAYCISGTSSTNNETVDFQLYKEATVVVGSKVRRKFGTASDFGAMSGCGVVTVASGDKISLALSNEDSAGNITLRNFTLVLIRL